MSQDAHKEILTRVGVVLLCAGLLDVAHTLYTHWQAYASGHIVLRASLAAILCGVFLLNGNLRAAWVTRWLAVLTVVVIAGSVIMLPLAEPVSLTLTRFRLMTADMLLATGMAAGIFALAVWVAIQLGKLPVRNATTDHGRKWRGNRVPVVLGIAIVAAMGFGVVRGLNGETRERAIQMASRQYGDSFSYTMSWHAVTHTSNGVTTRRAVVTAWNDNEIRFINVGWDE